jgi:hypothetical protein
MAKMPMQFYEEFWGCWACDFAVRENALSASSFLEGAFM